MTLRKLVSLIIPLLLAACTGSKPKAAPDADNSPVIAAGLSNQFVHSIAEDRQGHIWIGTFRGLNKYDSNRFYQYFASDDSTSINDDQIRHIKLDSRGRLWIASVNGVCLYTDKDNFHRIGIEGDGYYIKGIVEASDSVIYMHNYGSRILRYDEAAGSAETVLQVADPDDPYHCDLHPGDNGDLWIVTSSFIKHLDPKRGVVTDSVAIGGTPVCSLHPFPNEIWIAGERLLKIFDIRTRRFRPAIKEIEDHPVLCSSDFEYVHPYGTNGVLLYTSKDGMFLYDRKSGQIMHQNEDGFPFPVPDFKIKTMFTDSRGNLWFGSEDQGYAVHYHYKDRFNYNNFLSSRLKNKSVLAVAADSDNRLWAVTKRDGIFIYDHEKKTIHNIAASEFTTGNIRGDKGPINIIASRDGDMWVMTSGHELLRCSYNGALAIKERHSVWMPMEMYFDDDETLWVGTASPYIHYKRKGDTQFSKVQVFQGFCFTPGLAQFGENHILALAFNQPFKLLNKKTLEVSLAPVDSGKLKNAIDRSVFIPTALHPRKDGTFYIGSVTNGLLHYTPSTGKVEKVGGLPCPDISSIEEDDNGCLWVGTMNGMAKFDPDSARTVNYFAYDGTGGNQFYDRSSAKMQHGTVVFGGTHGLTFFRPGEVSESPDVPLLFETIKVNNRFIQPAPGSIIDSHLSCLPTVRLRHDENNFTILFSALDFCDNHRVKCQYMLAGVDPSWVDASDSQEASYANIAPGHYTFQVRIPTDDGHKFRTIGLDIEVSPVWWASWWAIVIYVIAGMAAVYLIFKARSRLLAERSATRHAKMEKERERKINTMNMRFFANVSHEFRTPLTMISGPVKQLAQSGEISGENRTLLSIVNTNVDRMLQLVNQMLDFNKLENDALRLKVERGDIVRTLREITLPFEVTARHKGITWVYYGFDAPCMMEFDNDKIIKIYTNLLSNALKYTPRSGMIRTSFDEVETGGKRYVKITVYNSGPAIPDDKLEKIFERYYQLENEDQSLCGSGIGLYYARRLAMLHHGSVRAVSTGDKGGACFEVLLPLGSDAYTDEERARTQQEQAKAFPLQSAAGSEPEKEEEEEDNDVSSEKPRILVIDDDAEVAFYIKTLLTQQYAVSTRYDADSAMEWLETNTPDLIISDVVMPGKDGMALCADIKEDIRLCHIPLILVTAKATVESQVEGMNARADAYVTKPFDPAFMLSLIRSLLDNREKMKRIVNSSTNVEDVDEEILSPNDNAFMTDLYALLEQEMDNPELDINNISRMMKMSRTKFYYKVKGLTGETPGVFFKTYKLNRAAELVLEGKHTISEIADMTGFSSLSHFSRTFKKQFGTSPSDYHRP